MMIRSGIVEPLFAGGMRQSVDGKYILFFDREGLPACTTFHRDGCQNCVICKNAVIFFKVAEDGAIICSGCGKFSREELQSIPGTA